MPAGLAVDKEHFEVAHYILGPRKSQPDWERQATAPPFLPPRSPGSYLSGIVFPLDVSVRLGGERKRSEKKQTAVADTVQKDATEEIVELEETEARWKRPPTKTRKRRVKRRLSRSTGR